MAEPERYCPLCDRWMVESTCPTHRVTTVAKKLLTGNDAASLAGATLAGRYRIERPLSSGGMGVVFLATQLAMERTVVVKVLRRELMTDEVAIKRFYREAQTVSRLNHPNIVSVFDFGMDGEVGLPFLVMDFIKGQTLWELVKSNPLTEQRAATLMHQVAKALIAAHDAGIVHRDLKPQNIMISRMGDGDEHVSVLDFGIAKILGVETTDPTLTGIGVSLGTPRYMSPEQCKSGREVTPRSDVYSLGCILFECVTGRPLFRAKEIGKLMLMQLTQPPPALPDPLPSGDPPTHALSQLLAEMLAKDASRRPDTGQVAKRLRELSLGSAPTARIVPAVAPPPPAPSSRRRSRPWSAVAAGGLAVAATAVYLAARTDPSPAPLDRDPGAAAQIEAQIEAPPARPIAPAPPPPLPPPPAPAPAVASKRVESVPSDAAILIDGREIGRTPNIVAIPDDRAALWIEVTKPGYNAERVQLTRSGGPVSVQLTRKGAIKTTTPKQPKHPKQPEGELPDLAPR